MQKRITGPVPKKIIFAVPKIFRHRGSRHGVIHHCISFYYFNLCCVRHRNRTLLAHISFVVKSEIDPRVQFNNTGFSGITL